MSENKNDNLKICECGTDLNEPSLLIDSFYPTKRNKMGEYTEWNICCQFHNCGCGRVVYSPSKEKAIKDWNDGKAMVETFDEDFPQYIQDEIDKL
jgi:hypothetical protein